MLKFFLRRSVLVAIGFILLASLILFTGDELSYAGRWPLKTLTARLLLIAVIVGSWGVVQLVKLWRSKQMSATLMAALSEQKGSTPAAPDSSKLRESFE